MDVLIVGAGPSGLTLACALAKAGVSFHLIDEAEQRSPYSRALVIHPRSPEILDRLGALEELLARGNHVRGLHGFTSAASLVWRWIFRRCGTTGADFPRLSS